MKKILYCILHGSMNPQRYYNVKETWGKDVDCLFYSDHEDKEKNIVKVSNRTDYHSNEEKHINSLKYINENHKGYEWYFFCDDDTFVDINKLEKLLDTLDKESVYGSIIHSWPRDKTLGYCSGGAGYLISNKLLEIIGVNIEILKTGYSDVTLGIYLRNSNIEVKDLDFFKSQPPESYSLNELDIPKYITFHYIKTKEKMSYLSSLNNL